MNNTEKKLDALIAAMGFDVEASTVRQELHNPYNSNVEVITSTDYKLTKRNGMVPIPIQSDAWGSVVNYCSNHRDKIEAGLDDFITLQPIWEFMKGKGNE
jgi:hypothetical protein